LSADDVSTFRIGLDAVRMARPYFQNTMRADTPQLRTTLHLLLAQPRVSGLLGLGPSDLIGLLLGKAPKVQAVKLPLRAPPLFSRSLGNLVSLLLANGAGRFDDQSLEEVRKLVEGYPEGTMFWLQGYLLFQAEWAEKEGKARKLRLLREARRSLEAAVEKPGLFPVRADGLELLLATEWAYLEQTGGKDAAVARQVTAHLWERLAIETPIEPAGQKIIGFAGIALKAGDVALAWRLVDKGEQLGMKPSELAGMRKQIKKEASAAPP